jgi:hypothetical protein
LDCLIALFGNALILAGLESASVRRSWRAFREQSPIPQSSKLFGMTRSYAEEGHSERLCETAHLEAQGPKKSHQMRDYRPPIFSHLMAFPGFGYSQAKMAPEPCVRDQIDFLCTRSSYGFPTHRSRAQQERRKNHLNVKGRKRAPIFQYDVNAPNADINQTMYSRAGPQL